jgi:hypothetical protein
MDHSKEKKKDYYAPRELPEARAIIIAVGVSVAVVALAFLVWAILTGGLR